MQHIVAGSSCCLRKAYFYAQATFATRRLGPRANFSRSTVTAMASNGKRVIVWLRNDLRLHDNYSLHKAAELVKAGTASEVWLLTNCNANSYYLFILLASAPDAQPAKLQPWHQASDWHMGLLLDLRAVVAHLHFSRLVCLVHLFMVTGCCKVTSGNTQVLAEA